MVTMIQLFSGTGLDSQFRQRINTMIHEINNLPDNDILNVSDDDRLSYLLDKYGYDIPAIDVQGITRNQDNHWQNRAGGQIPGTLYTFFVPYTGDSELFKLRPSQFPVGAVTGRIERNELVLEIFWQSRPGTPAQHAKDIEDRLEVQIRTITQNLEYLQHDIERYENELKEKAINQINFRKTKALDAGNISSELKYPLKIRPNAPQPAPQVRRKISPPKSNIPSNEPEHVLGMDIYEHALKVIHETAIMIERNPRAFQEMSEEDLRWLFIVMLNSHFEGPTAGEAFNYEGKTDILINVENKNIFIAECKFWKGQKSLTDTIDQLLGYATWRDTKLAILCFSRNKDFSKVVEQVPEVIAAHPKCKVSLDYSEETGFRHKIRHRDDPDREMILTTLVFNIPRLSD